MELLQWVENMAFYEIFPPKSANLSEKLTIHWFEMGENVVFNEFFTKF